MPQRNQTKKRRLTDADRQRIVQPLLTYWGRVLGIIGRWDMQVRFVDEGALGEAPGGSGVVGMALAFQGPYLDVSLSINRASFDKSTPAGREAMVLHELGHLVCQPISTELWRLIGRGTELEKRLEWAEEEVVDNFAQALLCARYGADRIMPRFVRGTDGTRTI